MKRTRAPALMIASFTTKSCGAWPRASIAHSHQPCMKPDASSDGTCNRLPTSAATKSRDVSLALLLGWPHELGVLVASLSFITVFSLRFRTRYYLTTMAVMLFLMVGGVILTGSLSQALLIYVALGLATLVYLQTFVSVAYDI